MAFPTVQATNTSADTTATTTHTVNLPTGIVSGNLLFVVFGMAIPDGQVITWPGTPDVDWHEFYRVDQTAGADAGMAGAWREADGTEGATITVTTSLSTKSAHVSYRITDHEDPDTQPPQAATALGANGQSDPPSLTPTGGAKDYLWLAVSARTHDNTGVLTPPTSYGSIVEASGGTGSGGILTSVSQQNLNAASEDPASYTGGDALAEWTAATVAIHPASAPPAAPAFLPELHDTDWVTDDTEAQEYVFWLTPDDVVVVEDMPALGVLEEQIADDVEGHDYVFWLGEDLVVVEDFQPLPEMVESVAEFDDTLYQWAAWPLAADVVLDEPPPLPVLEESVAVFDDTLYQWLAGPNSLSGLPGFTIGLVRVTSTIKGVVITLGLKNAKVTTTYKGVRDGSTD